MDAEDQWLLSRFGNEGKSMDEVHVRMGRHIQTAGAKLFRGSNKYCLNPVSFKHIKNVEAS